MVLLLCPFPVAASPPETLDDFDDIDALLNRGVVLLHGMRYEEALELFERVVELAPDDPRGYFFQSQVAFWQLLLDLRNEEHGERFQELSEKTIKVAKRRQRRARDDVRARLYLGRAHGNLGRYHAIMGEYLQAYRSSKRAKRILKDLVVEHPEQVDAELELGLYHYYADLAPRILKMLSFFLGIEGDREAGLDKLEKAARQGEHTRVDALFYLLDLNLRYEERYAEARRLGSELVEQYPDNLLFVRKLADSLRLDGQVEGALALYGRIAEQSRFPSQSRRARFELARTHLDGFQLEQAITAYTAAVSRLEETADTRHWSYGWSLYFMGYCHDLLGNRAQALAHYRQVPRSSTAAYDEARKQIRYRLTRADAALEHIDSLVGGHEYDQAAALIRQTLARLGEEDPEYPASVEPELHYQLARCHRECDEHVQAVSELEQVLTSPHEPPEWLHPWTHYHLGLSYLVLGKQQAAEQHLDRAAEYKKDQRLRLRIARTRRE